MSSSRKPPAFQLFSRTIVGGWLFVAGCEPGIGSSCDADEATCLNANTQLVCEDQEYIATPCRGPGGCAVLPNLGVACDISKNKPSDSCAKSEEGAATCVSDHQMIVCRSGKYEYEPCRGADGCVNEHRRAMCDKSVAATGDPCKQSAKACDAKGKAVLSCKDGKMSVLYGCLGPDGCQAKGKLDCDMSVAEQGDSCDPQMEGASACSVNKRSILACKGGKFVADEDCKDGEVCNPTGSISCEPAPEPDEKKPSAT